VRVLFLVHSFNSLTQRLFVALRDAGHEVSVEFDVNPETTIGAVELYRPDLIVAPFLKRAIPEPVWRSNICFVVHPGIVGDRGPSALDWAILDGESEWGVTVLQANDEMDAGDVWATRSFPMRAASKASLYRTEVTAAAVEALLEAVERFTDSEFEPVPLDAIADAKGRQRPLARQADRRIDWRADSSERILRKIHSADGFPGLEARLLERDVLLYDARPAPGHSGPEGTVVGTSGAALLVGTRDGAIWVGHLRDKRSKHPFKLPATRVMQDRIAGLPEFPVDSEAGYREIRVDARDDVVFLHFDFYNGAMSADQCERLRASFDAARARQPRVIVLAGGHDFWSNGMHLNCIEAGESPAEESWRNINAIDDLALDIIGATECLTVAALSGNAGAGGVFLARAADEVWSHGDVVLNPHYKDMGNLYGSEYWTYLLPRYCGEERARLIMEARLPMGIREALELGLVDKCIANGRRGFANELEREVQGLAGCPRYGRRIEAKQARRLADEKHKPLAEYRLDELDRMRSNFFGFDPSYHVARYNFVHKVPRSRTPLTLAVHRRAGHLPDVRQAS